MKYKALLLLSAVFICSILVAQEIKVPGLVYKMHPRFLAGNTDRSSFQSLVNSEEEAKSIYSRAKQSIESYADRHLKDSTWIVSRLQMYWKTRSTDVYIRGGVYDHADGEAPVPTVKFSGSRGGITNYAAPKLEDIQPYMDDPRGLLLVNKIAPGQPLEWVDISKTSGIVEGINRQIMGMANTAAVLYWISREEKYAKFAADLFDTYMTGMQYRKAPIDLTNGHHQTLAGLSTFEVIQEVALINSLTGIYDYLYDYLQKKNGNKMGVYTAVFKKWADIQIAHGVAFNNWNLMQAKNVLNIALVLDDDKSYSDGKGSQYYTNYILNTNSQRQWSLRKVVNEGFDPATGLWNESAGYSLGVINDLVGFVSFFDNYYKLDLLEQLPVIKKAVTGVAQYLFPNGYYASFGDSHYGRISLSAAFQLVANARKNNKPEQEKFFTAYIKAVQQYYKDRGFTAEIKEGSQAKGLNSLLYSNENTRLNDGVKAADISSFITPVLSSSHVSYFALRNGLDPTNGLMVAMSGSKGNHMHAGGISMEIYGKGYVLGPESGIGTNYFQADYAEYYSQFPAHNTVTVDGISAYPVMKSNHAFEVKSCYPLSGVSAGYFPAVSFGDLRFLEPETQSDQARLTSIIRTSDSTGYYIDIFRSKRRDGKDKMHDYIYHNIGQELLVNDNAGNALDLQPTEELSFGGGHLFAYDYLYDKKSIQTDKDIKAVFKLNIPGKEEVRMTMWIKGEKDRKIFSVKSPKSKAIDRMGLPNEIVELPMPTILARQSGEAWTKPFTVVFEPSTVSQPQSIKSIQSFGTAKEFTGLTIESNNGKKETIFSSADTTAAITYQDKSFKGSYAVISEKNKRLDYLFLGSGSNLAQRGYSITAIAGTTSAVLSRQADGWYYSSSRKVVLTVPANEVNSKVSVAKNKNGHKVIERILPASAFTKISF